MSIKKRFRELLLPFQSQTKRMQSSIKKPFCFLHLACSYNYPYNPHYQSVPLLKLFFISLFHLFYLFYLLTCLQTKPISIIPFGLNMERWSWYLHIHSKDGKILFEIFENFYDFIILLPLIIEIYGVLPFICVKYFVGIALNLIDR